MNRRLGSSLLFGYCSLVLLVGPVYAQDNNAALQEANARFKTGLAHAHQGKWEKARLSFMQAYSVLPNATDILWNLALAELEAGRELDALQHFQRFENDPKAEPSDIAALPMLRERAYKKIGRLKIEVPGDATVRIDGANVDWSMPINLATGEHVVKVNVGEQVEERRVTLSPGQIGVMHFTFPETTSPGPTSVPQSSARASGALVPAGALPKTMSEASTTRSSDVLRSSDSSPPRTLGWIGVGGTGAAIVLAVSFELIAHSKATEARRAGENGSPFSCYADESQPACGEARDAAIKYHNYRRLSTASVVTAGVLGVATASYFLFAPRSRPGGSVAPYVGPTQGGIILRGQF